jgi:hypothetical protein
MKKFSFFPSFANVHHHQQQWQQLYNSLRVLASSRNVLHSSLFKALDNHLDFKIYIKPPKTEVYNFESFNFTAHSFTVYNKTGTGK